MRRHQGLDRRPVQLGQPGGLRRRVGGVLEIRERGGRPPEGQGLPEHGEGVGGGQVADSADVLLEAGRVHVLRARPPAGTRVPALEADRGVAEAREGFAQTRDVAGEGALRAGRGVVPPRRLDERVDRDHRPGRTSSAQRIRRGTGPPTDTGPSRASSTNGPRTRSITPSL